MKYPIRLYVALNEKTFDKITERGGNPGLDEYRSYMYAQLTSIDSVFTFTPDIGVACKYALTHNLEYICEVLFDEQSCANAITDSLNGGSNDYVVLIKTVMQLTDFAKESQKETQKAF